MNTKNLKVKCLKDFSEFGFTEGKLYSVESAKKMLGSDHCIQVTMETNDARQHGVCWMKESMRSGDLSLSERFELVVEEDVTANSDDIGDAIQYSIDCAARAGGPIFAAMKRGGYFGKGFLPRCVLTDLVTLISKPNPDEGEVYGAGFEIGFGEVKIQPENGLIRQQNDDGTVSYFSDLVHRSPLSERSDQVTNRQVLEELRNVLRCPDGANIVIWAEILAAGYFGEKHRKGGAIEDAIHYKKNGAYSDETLAKILAAIVNDGTNC
ncbi:hypothetical protein AAS23_gp85 [Pantoea phage vB_PagS_AAS23]|uniref:Uncharacterized protein n=1 Tax=Pantoea phage vB_PagS_AAS23 TaxID=2499073 RepID=A0A3S9U805_9CAUD|nr:hypothetical protein HOU93_gp85 [Pantoea phage vB_PagS_AAS23]AZS06398.1 hypothetical protein AAS23_gp85 [Pantoea phage vB_PagS_AAS23]